MHDLTPNTQSVINPTLFTKRLKTVVFYVFFPYSGGTGANAVLRPKEVDLEATQAYGAEIDREDEEEPLSCSEVHSNLSTAETQLIPTAKSNDEDHDEEMPDDFNLSTADTLILASTPRREEQTQHFALFTAPTQLILEDKIRYFE